MDDSLIHRPNLVEAWTMHMSAAVTGGGGGGGGVGKGSSNSEAEEANYGWM